MPDSLDPGFPLADGDAGEGEAGQEQPTELYLKPRGAIAPVLWEEIAVDSEEVGPLTPLDEAEFVALDIETTGHRPFLVLEIGATRFRLAGEISVFDTLVNCRAPINPYARRRHLIDRHMLIGAPEFSDARQGFLRFATGAVLVEHSHDAFDTWLVGRGLRRPLEHPIVDTTRLGRLILDLPSGQTPGLARLVEELGLEQVPEHAALQDAQATAAVFCALIARARAQLGWETVGDVLASLTRPDVDRSSMEGPALSRRGPAPTGQPREGGGRRRRSRAGQASRAGDPASGPGPAASV